MIEDQDRAPPFPRLNCAHQARCAGPDYDHVSFHQLKFRRFFSVACPPSFCPSDVVFRCSVSAPFPYPSCPYLPSCSSLPVSQVFLRVWYRCVTGSTFGWFDRYSVSSQQLRHGCRPRLRQYSTRPCVHIVCLRPLLTISTHSDAWKVEALFRTGKQPWRSVILTDINLVDNAHGVNRGHAQGEGRNQLSISLDPESTLTVAKAPPVAL